MTEQEWLASRNPAAMLQAVLARGTHPRSGVTDAGTARRLRLFACACCRLVWDGVPCPRCKGKGRLATRPRDWERPTDGHGPSAYACPDCHRAGKVGGLTDPRSRRAVEVAERYADGEGADLFAVWRDQTGAGTLPAYACWTDAASGARSIAAGGFNGPVPPPAAQAALLREIFGNPFRPVVFRPDQLHWWPPWRELAQAAYSDMRLDRFAVLADALEEAGCVETSDETIPGVYVCERCAAVTEVGTGGVRCGSCGSDYCRKQRRRDLPHPLLAHLRGVETCLECRGTREEHFIADGVRHERWRVPLGVPCTGCDGKGVVPLRGPHVRGCHVIDALLGRE